MYAQAILASLSGSDAWSTENDTGGEGVNEKKEVLMVNRWKEEVGDRDCLRKWVVVVDRCTVVAAVGYHREIWDVWERKDGTWIRWDRGCEQR